MFRVINVKDFSPEVIAIRSPVVSTVLGVFHTVSLTLKTTPIRCHYMFNVRDISKVNIFYHIFYIVVETYGWLTVYSWQVLSKFDCSETTQPIRALLIFLSCTHIASWWWAEKSNSKDCHEFQLPDYLFMSHIIISLKLSTLSIHSVTRLSVVCCKLNQLQSVPKTSSLNFLSMKHPEFSWIDWLPKKIKRFSRTFW